VRLDGCPGLYQSCQDEFWERLGGGVVVGEGRIIDGTGMVVWYDRELEEVVQ